MSLKSVGVLGDIIVTTTEGSFCTDGYGDAKGKTYFLDAEKEMLRNLLEAYLESEQFKKDVYQLSSVIGFKITRSVNLVMPD